METSDLVTYNVILAAPYVVLVRYGILIKTNWTIIQSDIRYVTTTLAANMTSECTYWFYIELIHAFVGTRKLEVKSITTAITETTFLIFPIITNLLVLSDTQYV